MADILVTILPLAVVQSITPLGLIAVMLLLLSERRAVARGTAFTLGWALAVGVTVGGVAALMAGVSSPGSATETGSTIVNIALGVGLFLLGLWALSKHRATADAPLSEPAWIAKFDGLGVGASFFAGVALTAYPPSIFAGTLIQRTPTTWGERIVGAVLYAVVASITVAIPVLLLALKPDWARPRFHRWRHWLLGHRWAVGAWMLLVIGGWMVVQAIVVLV